MHPRVTRISVVAAEYKISARARQRTQHCKLISRSTRRLHCGVKMVYRITREPSVHIDYAKTRCYKTSINFWEEFLAVHPSVIKRHRQSLKRRNRNIETKSRLRTLIKKARQAIDAKNKETASLQIREVDQALGKAVSKGIIKGNTASRWLSRLSRSASRLVTPSS